MYKCKECEAPATVGDNGVERTCEHNTTVIMDMEAEAHGASKMNATIKNNNLSEQSQILTKAFLQVLTLDEFLNNNKTEIYVKDQSIEDKKSGRKFLISISGKEIL